jgi:hypothetical protein
MDGFEFIEELRHIRGSLRPQVIAGVGIHTAYTLAANLVIRHKQGTEPCFTNTCYHFGVRDGFQRLRLARFKAFSFRNHSLSCVHGGGGVGPA